MTTSTYIFNQYYIDLLKKIKNISKKHKSKSTTAQKVLKTIRDNYMTLDKASDEYIVFLKKNISDDVWKTYIDLENDDNVNNWFKDNSELNFFENITLNDITKLLRDNYLCHHYCTVLYIYQQELSEEESEKIVKLLQSINNKKLLDTVENENIKKILIRLEDLRNKTIKEKSGIDMQGIGDTTLGKLAKEILEDIDISKLKQSIGDDGDVLKAIGNPDSGFADLLTNVSKKMATKISNGELKQENLLQDAMKFASLMPGMFNQNGAGKGPGNAPDMSNLMSMMSSMMGGNSGNSGNSGECGMNDILKNMMGANQGGNKGKGGNGKEKTTFDNNKMRKMARMKQMREKLHKKNMSKTDDIDDVE